MRCKFCVQSNLYHLPQSQKKALKFVPKEIKRVTGFPFFRNLDCPPLILYDPRFCPWLLFSPWWFCPSLIGDYSTLYSCSRGNRTCQTGHNSSSAAELARPLRRSVVTDRKESPRPDRLQVTVIEHSFEWSLWLPVGKCAFVYAFKARSLIETPVRTSGQQSVYHFSSSALVEGLSLQRSFWWPSTPRALHVRQCGTPVPTEIPMDTSEL